MKNYLLFIALLATSPLLKGNITVSVKGYAGSTIALEKMSNALVPLFDTLAMDTLSAKDEAFLSFQGNSSGFYYLSIGNKHLPVPLEPNTDYSITLEPPKVEESLFGKFTIKHFEANGEKQTYLHDHISRFNKSLSRFITDNPGIQKDSVALKKLDSLGISLKSQLKTAFEDYPELQNYATYRFALFANTVAQYRGYLKQDLPAPKDVSKPLQIEVFLASYEPIINTWLYKKADTVRAISAGDSLIQPLKEELKKNIDPVNSFGVEIILFKLIYDKKLPGFTDEKRITALEELGKSTSFASIGEACKSAYQKLNKLLPNTKAPNFQFSDNKGRTVSLELLKGRFIFLQFWNQKNTAGLLDMKLIDKIRKTYGKKIAFVSIHCYGSEEDFHQYMETHNYKWPIFHVERNHPLLLDYAVQTTPMYYLIDPEGYLFRSPAERPNRMYLLFDKINASEIDGVKSYEIIRTYDE